ncbi:MAG TPA: DUF2203 domain-containing protein [Myxococcota bacterium]|nr:DUF2203 domain-containing protein [Myxococcota bacterium]
MILKTVTLQEANGLLPLVREHFFRIHVMLAHLQHLRSRLPNISPKRFVFDDKNEMIVVIRKKGRSKKFKATSREIREIERLIEKEINDLMRLGAVIKGLVPPHIDFLSIKNQEPIFLCWHGGESEIKHWHQLDDGSPFRHIIAKGSRFGPHVVH